MYEIHNNSPYDLDRLTALMHKFIPYAQNFLKYDKPVDVELVSDVNNAKEPLGRTAMYDPASLKVSIYTDGRHTKDILRSLSHELVHHAQNCRGEFDKPHNAGEGYIKKDPHLQNMEGEAYLLGNGFMIRFFEEYMKEDGMMSESRFNTKKTIVESVEKEIATPKEEPTPDRRPETVEEYRLRRKKIIADELMRRWVGKGN